MDDSNDILKALGQVPELAEAAKRILAANEEFKKLFAEMMKLRVQAEVPQEEIRKIYAATSEAIRKTPCLLPDTTELSEQIAKKAAMSFAREAYNDTKDMIRQAFKDTHVQHVYTYVRPRDLLDALEPKAKAWTVIASILSAVLLLTTVFGFVLYRHSEVYYGQQYIEEAISKYATDEEKEMLRKDTYSVSGLPKEYYKTPKIVQQRIKRNKEILLQREAEARANKGKFSTRVPLER